MTKVIHKQQICRSTEQGRHIIKVPRSSEFLIAGEQGGDIHVWYAHDGGEAVYERVVDVIWTGHKFDLHPCAKHLSTVFTSCGIVAHVMVEK